MMGYEQEVLEKKNTHIHMRVHTAVEKLALLVASRCNFLEQ